MTALIRGAALASGVMLACCLSIWPKTVWAAGADSAGPKPGSGSGNSLGATSNQVQQGQLQLQGRVVCLAEEMHQRYGTELPTRHQHVWAFKTTNGVCYTLLEGKFSQAIFQDERVRAKELRVKGRLLPNSQALELSYFRSVKNGVPQNLYYYCEICAISTVSPEPCACCQAPVILIEKPISEREE